jgi:PleD family two-component response regulator
LGLALAKRYLEKMGGSLLVDSIKGVGTTFTFTLPLSHSISRKNSSSKKEIKTSRILMLDDSGDSFELLKAFLKNTHIIDVYNFRDFKFDFINEKEYKAIVFDVNQNHWDQSLIICKELKRSDPYGRPIIVISSEFSDEKISEFYRAGANKFLIKPFTKTQLLQAI